MEGINCIFCGTGSDRVVIEENGFFGRKCPECGLIYLSPRPSAAEIRDLYADDMAHRPAAAHISGTFQKRLYARHNLRIIERYVNHGTLLEIGAGGGYFLDEARKEGFDVYGIELNSIQADFIRGVLSIPCEESPLSSSSFAGKKFDIVYHCDVVSHFYDPIEEFRNMNNALNKNGIIAFETGNLGDIKEKYFKLHTSFQYPDHLFFFGETSLTELLRMTGFQPLRIHRYSILVQRWFEKLLEGCLQTYRRSERENISEDRNLPCVRTSRFNRKQMLRNAYHYFFYLVRYRIGAIMPKKGRPQTIFIIGRKSND